MTKQEMQLLENFRAMTEQDRKWILALSEGCGKRPEKDKEEVIYTVRVSAARE